MCGAFKKRGKRHGRLCALRVLRVEFPQLFANVLRSALIEHFVKQGMQAVLNCAEFAKLTALSKQILPELFTFRGNRIVHFRGEAMDTDRLRANALAIAVVLDVAFGNFSHFHLTLPRSP